MNHDEHEEYLLREYASMERRERHAQLSRELGGNGSAARFVSIRIMMTHTVGDDRSLWKREVY